jgi:hypothetical protein
MFNLASAGALSNNGAEAFAVRAYPGRTWAAYCTAVSQCSAGAGRAGRVRLEQGKRDEAHATADVHGDLDRVSAYAYRIVRDLFDVDPA